MTMKADLSESSMKRILARIGMTGTAKQTKQDLLGLVDSNQQKKI